MRKSKQILRFAALALGLALLLGAAALAANDTTLDPLVTLSYLTGEFTDSILSQARQIAGQSDQQALQDLQTQAEAIARTANETAQQVSAGYETVNLAAGQTLDVAEGTEVLVLSGSAAASAAVTDVTQGTLVSGGPLAVYHLYICAMPGTLTASGDCSVLVK